MRNLKKILALVLAFALALSVMAVTSAADFVDADEIEHIEAVNVMAALGVLAGKPTGNGEFNFDPNGLLKRQEAAKIMAYVMAGDYDYIEDVASHMSHPFTDVAKGDWAETYVAYCYNEGILSGMDATTFGYNGYLTGYQLGKLLLCAAGIGEAAKYEGAGWELAVYRDLKANNLLTDVSISRSNITRQDACQLVWNVMNWSPAGESEQFVVWRDIDGDGEIDTNETEILYKGTDALIAALIKNQAGGNAAFKRIVKTVGSLADTAFGLTVDEATDEYGRLTKVYKSTRIPSMNVVLSDDAATTSYVALTDATVTNGTTLAAAVNTALNLTGGDALAQTNAKMYVNGYEAFSNIKKGDRVEVYVSDEAITKVIVIRETLEQASRAPAAETTGSYKGLYKWTFGSDAFTYAAENAYEDEAYYTVIENPNTHAAISIEIPAMISNAKITAADNASLATATYVVVNGTKLHKAGTFVDVVEGGMAYNTAYDYFISSNGYLMAVAATGTVNVEEAPETGYAYLLGAEKQVSTSAVGSTIIGGAGSYSWNIVAKAKLALGDGSIKVVDLNTVITTNEQGVVTAVKLNGQTVKNCEITNNATPVDLMATGNLFDGYTWVKYTVGKDGTYILESVSPSALTIGKGQADVDELSGKLATSNTVWAHYVYNTVTGTVEVTKLTGIAKFKDGTYQGVAAYSATNPELITTLSTFASYTPEINANYAYYLGQGEYTYGLGYAQKFAINGSVVEFFIGDVELGSVNSVYDLTLDTNGTVIGAETVSFAKEEAVEVLFIDNTYIIAGGETLYLDNACVIYNVAGTNPTGAADTLSTKLNAAGTGDMIKYIVKDGKVVAIYIVSEAVKG